MSLRTRETTVVDSVALDAGFLATMLTLLAAMLTVFFVLTVWASASVRTALVGSDTAV